MKKNIWTLTFALTLNACAVQPIPLNDRASEAHQIPYQKLLVDNLAVESKINVNDVVYVNGWAPAHEGFNPPLHKAFAAKVKNSIIANGGLDRVDVSILRVGYFYEKIVADDVVFVGLFMVGRERGFKCDADINIKTNTESRRMTLSHEVRRSHFENQEELKTFIETCQSDLIKQLANAIRNPAGIN